MAPPRSKAPAQRSSTAPSSLRPSVFEALKFSARDGWQQAIALWRSDRPLPPLLAESVAQALEACLADPGNVAFHLGLKVGRGRPRKGGSGPVLEHEVLVDRSPEVPARSTGETVPSVVPAGEGAAEALARLMFDRAQARLLPHPGDGDPVQTRQMFWREVIWQVRLGHALAPRLAQEAARSLQACIDHPKDIPKHFGLKRPNVRPRSDSAYFALAKRVQHHLRRELQQASDDAELALFRAIGAVVEELLPEEWGRRSQRHDLEGGRFEPLERWLKGHAAEGRRKALREKVGRAWERFDRHADRTYRPVFPEFVPSNPLANQGRKKPRRADSSGPSNGG